MPQRIVNELLAASKRKALCAKITLYDLSPKTTRSQTLKEKTQTRSGGQRYVVTTKKPNEYIGNNRIYGNFPDESNSLKIFFKGNNNIVHFSGDPQVFHKSKIVFKGDNSVVFLSASEHKYSFVLRLKGDNICYFGENLFMNSSDPLKATLEKGQNLFIGKDCLFSLNIRLFAKPGRRADTLAPGHIYIGNHVWLAQNTAVTVGSEIGSGAIIGGGTLVDRQQVEPLGCYAVRGGVFTKLKDNVMFIGRSIRNIPAASKEINSVISEKYLSELLKLSSSDDFAKFRNVEKARTPQKRYTKLLKLLGDKGTYKVPKWRAADEVKDLIQKKEAVASEAENRIIGSYNDLGDNKIEFRGHGNTLVFEEGVSLKESSIIFNGNDSIVYLCRSDNPYRCRLISHCDTTLFIGPDAKFDEDGIAPTISVAECKSVIAAENCSFGEGSWIRTSDQHPIYDIGTRRRINEAKSVILGDHAAVRSGKLILKGKKLNISENESCEAVAKACKRIDKTSDTEAKLAVLEKLSRKLSEQHNGNTPVDK